MKKIVFDSFALIAYFRKEPGYTTIRDLLVQIASNDIEAFVCSINVGEIYYMMCRKANTNIAEAAIQSLKQFPLHFVDADLKLCLDAAKLKARYKFSYADAFAASLSISNKATLITGDKEFDALAGVTGFKVKYL